MLKKLSDNGISAVWFDHGLWVYKTQPKFMCDSEEWCLEKLHPSGYVPEVQRSDIETLRIRFIEVEPITDRVGFMAHYEKVLLALAEAGIRHGDLTEYSVLSHANRPFLIDFSESRLACDPRPDKRPEGDAYWLKRTMEKLCG